MLVDIPDIKYHKNPGGGSNAVPCRPETDRHNEGNNHFSQQHCKCM
jgi:hypothetical protein